mgnify:CR=1 FL=1|tara:strand:- start:2529 stop:2669 length:141 start_codon:yes stop_codon:yes gene_type:complete
MGDDGLGDHLSGASTLKDVTGSRWRFGDQKPELFLQFVLPLFVNLC